MKNKWMLLILIALLPAAYVVLWAFGGLLVIADPLERVDALVLLSGGDEARVDEAARLFREGYADVVILTDTGGYIPEWNLHTTESVKLELIEKGIPGNFILITETMVSSTIDEARATRKLMNLRNYDSLLVVTDPFHTFRTRLIFDEVFHDTTISVSVRPAPSHWYRSNTWFLSIRGWRTTIQEYAKIVVYLSGRVLRKLA